MWAALERIMERALERLAATSTAYLPSILAALIILAGAGLLACIVRWILNRIIKAAGLNRFLVQSGLASMLVGSGRVRAGALVAETAYWIIWIAGALTALSVFETQLTSRMIEAIVFLLPKLVTAGVIVLAGAWLGRFLGRGVLVWACNEGVPGPRLWASLVRIGLVFVAVVVAADHLNFAKAVFLAAFILLAGGIVLAASLALGLAGHGFLERRLRDAQPGPPEPERAYWNHV